MSSTKTLLADFKGLVTAPGLLMRAEASCTLARNALFDAPGLLRKRPGFSRLQYGMGGPIYQLHSSPILDTRFFAHYGSTTNPGTVRLGDGTTGASTLIPSIDPQSVSRPAALRQRMAFALVAQTVAAFDKTLVQQLGPDALAPHTGGEIGIVVLAPAHVLHARHHACCAVGVRKHINELIIFV